MINASIPPFIPHGWKYLVFDKNGWIYTAYGVPCNICMPPPGTASVRHIDPKTGMNDGHQPMQPPCTFHYQIASRLPFWSG
jgi:hypothetical protein